VKLFLFYKEHRPTVDTQSRFYLQPNRNWEIKGNWFNTEALGNVNHGKIANTVSEKAGSAGKHSNYSGRKTFVSKLLDQGVPPTEVPHAFSRIRDGQRGRNKESLENVIKDIESNPDL